MVGPLMMAAVVRAAGAARIRLCKGFEADEGGDGRGDLRACREEAEHAHSEAGRVDTVVVGDVVGDVVRTSTLVSKRHPAAPRASHFSARRS
jgi:hypothetical protein